MLTICLIPQGYAPFTTDCSAWNVNLICRKPPKLPLNQKLFQEASNIEVTWLNISGFNVSQCFEDPRHSSYKWGRNDAVHDKGAGDMGAVLYIMEVFYLEG